MKSVHSERGDTLYDLSAHADFEPRQLFNVAQFIMTDKENRGIMTLEEAMQVCSTHFI